jgi:hypothetical protein
MTGPAQSAIIRLACYGVAFAVGWVVYMIAMLMPTYDGAFSLIFQPIMAALCSGLFTGAALDEEVRRWCLSESGDQPSALPTFERGGKRVDIARPERLYDEMEGR